MTIPEEMSTDTALSPQPQDGSVPSTEHAASFKIDPSAQPQEEQSQIEAAAQPQTETPQGIFFFFVIKPC